MQAFALINFLSTVISLQPLLSELLSYFAVRAIITRFCLIQYLTYLPNRVPVINRRKRFAQSLNSEGVLMATV